MRFSKKIIVTMFLSAGVPPVAFCEKRAQWGLLFAERR